MELLLPHLCCSLPCYTGSEQSGKTPRGLDTPAMTLVPVVLQPCLSLPNSLPGGTRCCWES